MKKTVIKSTHTRTYLAICLLVAVLVSLLNSRGVMDERIMPFGDSGGFYKYSLTLYGQVHSGQWADVMETLVEPSRKLFPTSLIFLLLPETLANSAGFGFVNNLSWHLMTIVGIWIFFSTFGWKKFTIPVFLLVAANNYALDPTFHYYMDFSFMGVALLGLSMTVHALQSRNAKSIVTAGALASLTFLSKPPNALINTALLACLVGGVLVTKLVISKNKAEWHSSIKFVGLWVTGFIPIFILALFCGALESIVDVIYVNELGNVFYTELSEGGMKRIFYFPLCLSFYYSLPLILGFLTLLTACITVPPLKRVLTSRSSKKNGSTLQIILIWIFIIFILFWGLHFSFILKNKLVRSLTPMLPLLWIFLFLATPLRTLRLRVVLPLCTIIFLLPFTQAEFGVFKDKQNRNPEYHLNGDWFNRWPAKRPDLARGTAVTDQLKQALNQAGVHSGKIGVGTEMINWNAHSLDSWCNQNYLRKGQPPAYDFKYICPGRHTKPLKSTMEGADALLLILEPRIQYSQTLYKINIDLMNYAVKNWQNKIARVNVLYNQMKQPVICVIAFNQPLQGEPLDKLKNNLYNGDFSEKGNASSEFKLLSLRQKIAFIWKALEHKE